MRRIIRMNVSDAGITFPGNDELMNIGLPANAAISNPMGLVNGRHPNTTGDITISSAQATSGTSTTSGTSGTGTLANGSSSVASPFVINITWDASVASAPSGFTTGVMAAVQYFESHFFNPVTININVGWGEIGGIAVSSLGASGSNWYGYYSASQMDSYLKNTATSTADQTAYSHLPSSAPAGTAGYWVTSAQAKALGMTSGSSTNVDGYIGFGSGYKYTFDNSTGIVTSGTYDLIGVAEHEISEILGRISGLGPAGSGSAPSIMDMFRYTAGLPSFSYGSASYFSIDGGVTHLANFNASSGGDSGDWASGVPSDAADAFATSGIVMGMSAVDATALDVIGWNTVASTTTTTSTQQHVTAPTGVAIATLATSLFSALSAAAAMAKVTQVGGTTGDTFTYQLGGTGASAFTLSTSSSVGTLGSSASGLAGSTTGTLYSLTLTATDVTANLSSPAVGVDVIVGSSGDDTISVATLVGNLRLATPTFVFGQGGNDTLNGSSMTGREWFIGSGGADTMTGGSGSDTYMYSAVSDSTSASMDIIANFSAAADRIDLSGLRTVLQVAGSISSNGKNGNTLAAQSVGWQTSGGNTFVYVNTSGARENIGATDMKIELQGSVSLSSSDFIHA